MQATKYALCCGAVQRVTVKECPLFITYVELYQEHSHFHVRAFQRVKGSSSVDRLAWNVFESNELTKARQNFKNLTKELK
jgi:hypothetical protein